MSHSRTSTIALCLFVTASAAAVHAESFRSEADAPPGKGAAIAAFQKQIRGRHVDAPRRDGRRLKAAERDARATIPHWTGSFTHQGLTYPYTMVGTDPKRGSATTTIPTVLIPLRFVFEDGTVMDASADSIDGRTSIEGILASPIFQRHEFSVGGIGVGNTQYGDAFQRANFWTAVSRGSRDYHVLLAQPRVAPAFEVAVPAWAVDFVTDPDSGSPVPLIDGGVLVQAEADAIAHAGVSPQALPIVVWGNAFGRGGFGGFHGAFEVPGGLQTAISTGYHPRSPSYFLAEDTYILSHEILEWMNDPFTDNFTPGWSFPGFEYPHCISSPFVADTLEVADVLEFFAESDVEVPMGPTSFHVADSVFLDYFTRAPSAAANGQYTFFGITTSPSPKCAGHVELDLQTFEVPGATSTNARGINNRGWIVGDFVDASRRRHGFVYDRRGFTPLDYPGAVSTIAYKINDAGQIVGSYTDAGGLIHGFSYGGGAFASIDVPGSLDNTAIARGINSRGDIVGEYDLTVPITHGFTLQGGQYQTLDSPFGVQAEIGDINDAGVVVGDAYDDPTGIVHGFSFDGRTYRLIDFPGAEVTLPSAVNNRGEHGGFFTDPFFGSNGYVTIRGYPYEVYAAVNGLNDTQAVGFTFRLVNCDSAGFCQFRRFGYVATLPK